MTLQFQTKTFDELANHELYAVLRLRTEVFVVEQNCVFQDMDGLDDRALHVLGLNPKGELGAYCRLFAPGQKYENACISRVITAPAQRGSGAGRLLMESAIAECATRWPAQGIRISAQAHLDKFYASLGFVSVGDVYLEDDIPHQEMHKP
jgi:ElaA protein